MEDCRGRSFPPPQCRWRGESTPILPPIQPGVGSADGAFCRARISFSSTGSNGQVRRVRGRTRWTSLPGSPAGWSRGTSPARCACACRRWPGCTAEDRPGEPCARRRSRKRSAASLPYFRRKLRLCPHCSILSGDGASAKAGAAHGATIDDVEHAAAQDKLGLLTGAGSPDQTDDNGKGQDGSTEHGSLWLGTSPPRHTRAVPGRVRNSVIGIRQARRRCTVAQGRHGSGGNSASG